MLALAALLQSVVGMSVAFLTVLLSRCLASHNPPHTQGTARAAKLSPEDEALLNSEREGMAYDVIVVGAGYVVFYSKDIAHPNFHSTPQESKFTISLCALLWRGTLLQSSHEHGCHHQR